MQVKQLDHVNIQTANVERMAEWYGRVLNMPSGKRPPFDFPGAWLYCGDHPVVHLVGVREQPPAGHRLEHFALTAGGFKEFLAQLDRDTERYEARRVPGTGVVQVNVWDPDGNHIHIDFPPEDAAGVAFNEAPRLRMR
jgi:catechol 2,3-dioxygenase-like lactoylglutathione lyase family enzyme